MRAEACVRYALPGEFSASRGSPHDLRTATIDVSGILYPRSEAPWQST